MRIVMSGATGFVGRQIVPKLRALGFEILIISREPVSARRLLPGLEIVSPEEWLSNVGSFDAFVYLSVMNSDQDCSLQDFLVVNRDMALHYAKIARAKGVSRFVYFSSVKALDSEENTPYAVSKREGQSALRSFLGTDLYTVHLGLVHGTETAGRLSLMDNFSPLIRRAIAQIVFALRPTTSADRVVGFIQDVCDDIAGSRTILTDDKAEMPFYRGWVFFLNTAFVLASIILSPILLVSWLVVVSTQGFPGFYRQERVGLEGRLFRFIKIRTMYLDAPAKSSHEVSSSFIFPFGRFLRKTKLDELVQAWHVARGEMNLIGPRPSMSSQSDVIHRRRRQGILRLKPGLTGWAQVQGVDMESPAELVRYDGEYLDLRSIALDARIVLLTFFRGFRGTG